MEKPIVFDMIKKVMRMDYLFYCTMFVVGPVTRSTSTDRSQQEIVLQTPALERYVTFANLSIRLF